MLIWKDFFCYYFFITYDLIFASALLRERCRFNFSLIIPPCIVLTTQYWDMHTMRWNAIHRSTCLEKVDDHPLRDEGALNISCPGKFCIAFFFFLMNCKIFVSYLTGRHNKVIYVLVSFVIKLQDILLRDQANGSGFSRFHKEIVQTHFSYTLRYSLRVSCNFVSCWRLLYYTFITAPFTFNFCRHMLPFCT